MSEPSMEFTLDEDQESVADLAHQVFTDLSNDERQVASERSGEPYDAKLWEQVVATGIVEAILPEDDGTAGLGLVGLALIAREQGRRLARVPLAPTGVAALALAEFGGFDDTIAGIVDGRVRIAVVLPEVRHRVEGQPEGDSWRLTGSIESGYSVPSATHLLVQFAGHDGNRLALIETDRPGVDIDAFDGISRLSHAAVSFHDVVVSSEDVVGGDRPAGEAATWLRPRLLTAMAAVTAGACAEAVRRTATYTSEREQFGRPISTNQGVALRAADAHIDSEVIWLTTVDAAWQLDHDGDGLEAALTASWWAREGGFRVVHAAQHLHGGMGADVDSHIHRFFLWVRELDVLWGTSAQVIEELADVILPREGVGEHQAATQETLLV
ncbi:acyl-CoA dehydrogenase family protein [Arthrobacter rhombi]|uniref:acyl-CoA dehydrogenase family protein n=1 Tax=Arthrobacter rhombi TaxID=71253 RepID=UPI003FD1FE6B